MADTETVDARCRRCMGYTRHEVLATKQVEEVVEHEHGRDVISRSVYRMIQCRGCEAVSLVEREGFPEYDGNVRVYFYPPPLARRIPEWHLRLVAFDGEMRELLAEIYSAMRADTRRLALMGVRTLVDMLLNDQVGPKGGFRERMDRLVDTGHISPKNRLELDAVLEAGHAAAHRGYQPSAVDLGWALDILENVLQSLYVLDEYGGELGKSTPPRAE